MVQEGITNALKHAPGASLEVTVRGSDDGVEIRVVNGPAGAGAVGAWSVPGVDTVWPAWASG